MREDNSSTVLQINSNVLLFTKFVFIEENLNVNVQKFTEYTTVSGIFEASQKFGQRTVCPHKTTITRLGIFCQRKCVEVSVTILEFGLQTENLNVNVLELF